MMKDATLFADQHAVGNRDLILNAVHAVRSSCNTANWRSPADWCGEHDDVGPEDERLIHLIEFVRRSICVIEQGQVQADALLE